MTTKTDHIHRFVSGVEAHKIRRVSDGAIGITIYGAVDANGNRSINQVPFSSPEEGEKAFSMTIREIRALEDRKIEELKAL